MSYGFHKSIEIKEVGKRGVKVHWAYCRIHKGRRPIYRFYLTCRSNLYRLMTEFFFYGSYKDDMWTSVSDEQYAVIKTMLRHRKEYKLWSKIRACQIVEGTEKARSLLMEKIQVFRLGDMMIH